mmetsp:Transcript_2357/g.9119  ORF Transcript_2357/g.9119 Transcript_2357/m.9119 type:complete len:300 (+) Transcript_2357:1631-2530(+)
MFPPVPTSQVPAVPFPPLRPLPRSESLPPPLRLVVVVVVVGFRVWLVRLCLRPRLPRRHLILRDGRLVPHRARVYPRDVPAQRHGHRADASLPAHDVQSLLLGLEGFVHLEGVKGRALVETRDAALENLRDGDDLRDGLANPRERDPALARVLESSEAVLDDVTDLPAGRHPDLIVVRGKRRRRRVDLDVPVHVRRRGGEWRTSALRRVRPRQTHARRTPDEARIFWLGKRNDVRAPQQHGSTKTILPSFPSLARTRRAPSRTFAGSWTFARKRPGTPRWNVLCVHTTGAPRPARNEYL